MSDEKTRGQSEVRSAGILELLSKETEISPAEVGQLVSELISLDVQKDMVNALPKIKIPKEFNTLLNAIAGSAIRRGRSESLVWVLENVSGIKDVPVRLEQVVNAILEIGKKEDLKVLLKVSGVLTTPRLKTTVIRAVILSEDQELIEQAQNIFNINNTPLLMKALRTRSVAELDQRIQEWKEARG